MLHFVNLVRCLQLSSRYPDPEQTPEFEVSDSGIISLTSDLGERDFAERDMKWMGKSRPTVQEQISIARQRNSKATRLCVLEGIPKQMPNIIILPFLTVCLGIIHGPGESFLRCRVGPRERLEELSIVS